MDIDTFITLADKYANLGGAIQDQFKTVLENGGATDENPNALRYIEELCNMLAQNDIDDASYIAMELRRARA